MYFSIFHWIAIFVFVIISVTLVYFAYKNLNTKGFLTASFAIAILSMFCVIVTIMTIDSTMKEVKLLDVASKQVYRNESFFINGTLKNIGILKVKSCYLKVSMVDISQNRLSHGVFKNRPWFSEIFSSSEEKPQDYHVEILVSNDIEPNSIKKFAVNAKYPTYMSKIRLSYKLDCH